MARGIDLEAKTEGGRVEVPRDMLKDLGLDHLAAQDAALLENTETDEPDISIRDGILDSESQAAPISDQNIEVESSEGRAEEGGLFEGEESSVLSLDPENAQMSDNKVAGYFLNLNHERGRHKAIVFEQVLGYTAKNSEDFKKAVYEGLPGSKKKFIGKTEYGEKVEAMMDITGPTGRTATVVTGWIKRPGNQHYDLVSAYILEGRKARGKKDGD